MMLPCLGPDERCIGVALRVPEPLAGRLIKARHAAGDPYADIVPPHITLVPPIAVHERALASVSQHIDRCVSAESPFQVRLVGTGTFRPVSPVVFVEVASGRDESARLEKALRKGPLACKPRFPYYPHVTLAHEVADQALDCAQRDLAELDESFDVTHVDLFEMDARGLWNTRGAFALRGLSARTATVSA
jgi:2'-5' RNA ligase